MTRICKERPVHSFPLPNQPITLRVPTSSFTAKLESTSLQVTLKDCFRQIVEPSHGWMNKSALLQRCEIETGSKPSLAIGVEMPKLSFLYRQPESRSSILTGIWEIQWIWTVCISLQTWWCYHVTFWNPVQSRNNRCHYCAHALWPWRVSCTMFSKKMSNSKDDILDGLLSEKSFPSVI